TPEEWLKSGERIQMLRHCFNLREGFTPGDFQLPPRAKGVPPFSYGPLKGVTLDEDAIRRSCLNEMGIDEITGRPSPDKLRELGLEDLVAP
ncbi:MAG: aldehyde ferredoxin oxidoreductase C-terminal domain-containing protein, partial [Dehalococcoidia bacterium]|nr:aldehyde ferredoxin oxidoreductase C-terminal domain-containing protein [Dehalococcoidia bacterium]